MIQVLYTTSNTHNCKDFVSKLNYENTKELKSKEDFPNEPYILVTGTYADANGEDSLHEKVLELLQDPKSAKLLRGVCASGNRNFTKYFALSSFIIANALKVPIIRNFELKGLPEDVSVVAKWIESYNSSEGC